MGKRTVCFARRAVNHIPTSSSNAPMLDTASMGSEDSFGFIGPIGNGTMIFYGPQLGGEGDM
ncbi:UNVERIFIED_CONTAM: hypothetical protein Slati_2468900 [Sesamum latifolium]|uniref:Uncharacterized protein n=1 Tax=Sesamum latifolium TaxID=2727402 RepID=A0AAW2WEQ8_9LAMI